MRTQLAQGFATSRLRYALVIVLSVLLWFGLFHLVREGFQFMRTTLPLRIHEKVVQAIFNTFFFALFLMLIFSSGVILYGSLFRGGEVAYLLTLPIHEERIFQHEFQHAVLLEQLGLRAPGQPDARGLRRRGRRPVVLLCHGAADAGRLRFHSGGDRRDPAPGDHAPFSPQAGAPAGDCRPGLLVVAAVWFFWSLFSRPETDLLTPRWFQEMLHRLQLAQEKPLPNWWLSSGLLEAAGHAWSEGVIVSWRS